MEILDWLKVSRTVLKANKVSSPGPQSPRCNSRLWGKVSWAAVFENERKGKTETQLHEGLPVCYCGYFYLQRVYGGDTEGNMNQPTQADSEESDCQEVCFHPSPLPPPSYNTQMDCHIRFRCIGYYTLGLLFQTRPSAWRCWVWGLSLLVLFYGSLSSWFLR